MEHEHPSDTQKLAALRAELEAARSSVAELQLLNEIAIASGLSPDLDRTLGEIVQKSLRAFGAEEGSIQLLTPDETRPFRTVIRQDERTAGRRHFRVGEGITGWVLSREEPLLVTDLSTDPRFQTTEDERQELRSLISAPIWFEGSIIGLLTILNKRDGSSFSCDDLTLLSIIAVQSGQLIKNSERRQENLRRQQEAELARWEAEKLRELDQWKTTLFTNIAHELRTPLTLILAPLEMLLRGTVRGDLRTHYAQIHRQAERLARRVNELLDLAAIDAGKMALTLRRCDLGTLLRSIVASFESAASEKSLDLRFEASPEPLRACCDKDKVDTIVTNLLSNAIKFTPPGGMVAVRLVSSGEPQTGCASISVEDSGVGIAEEDRQRIFDRFYRAGTGGPSTAGAVTAPGSGIGLALVKELVQIHQGTVDVTSAPGKGTTFTVTLRVDERFYREKGIVCLDAAEPETVLNERPAETAAPEVEPPPAAETVLIAEDNPDLRKFIRETLRDYRILEAADGAEALVLACENPPDIVISDVMMPGMDGLALCKRLKEDERTSHIPVILLTSKAGLESRVEGLETGADDYIAKPFSTLELQARLRNLLNERRRLRERYRREVTLQPKDIAITSADERFLQRVLQIAEKHLSDGDFSVESFAGEAGMSKTHLNRKLKALTDQSANEFVRTFRLKRAAQLLSGRHGNISEIAYEVGFNNPSYFSESFRELFGCSPSEYVPPPSTHVE